MSGVPFIEARIDIICCLFFFVVFSFLSFFFTRAQTYALLVDNVIHLLIARKRDSDSIIGSARCAHFMTNSEQRVRIYTRKNDTLGTPLLYCVKKNERRFFFNFFLFLVLPFLLFSFFFVSFSFSNSTSCTYARRRQNFVLLRGNVGSSQNDQVNLKFARSVSNDETFEKCISLLLIVQYCYKSTLSLNFHIPVE